MADNTTLNTGTGGDVIATDDISGVKYQRVKLSLGADGTATDVALGSTTMANSIPVTIATNDAVRYTHISSNDASAAAGITATVDPTGALNVSSPSTQVFTDSFDGGTVDTTNRWTTQVGGGGTVTQASGKLTLDSGTTALGYAAIFSKQAFAPKNMSIDQLGYTIVLETPLKNNLTRFWGKGTVPGTPTVAVPITDGFGFQLDDTGTFRAVIYSAGTLTSSIALTTPADANQHVYAILYRGDTTIMLVDNFNIPVASFTAQPSVQTLPIAVVAVAGASGPTAGQTLQVNLVAAGDSGKNTNQISDGIFPWRVATVKAASIAPVSTDTSLVTSVHPLSGISTASGTITTQNLVPAGTATANSAVEITLNGANTLGIQTTGTYTGALSLQVTMDGTTWVTFAGVPLINLNTGGYLATITSALQSVFQADVGGALKARITGLAAVTGTATVTLRATQSAALVSLDTSLPTGTNSIGNLGTVTTLTTCSTVTTLANGQTAHSSASTGSPVRIGGRIATAIDTTLAAGDASDLAFTTNGAATVKPYAVPELDWTYAAAASGIVNTTTAVTIKTAAAASVRNYITSIDISTDGALATATEVAIRDGAAGTVLWRMKIGTAGLQNGRTINFPTPLRGTAATLLEVVTLTASATGAVYFNAQGYTAV